MVRGVLGVDPEVITGDEEARLSFTGAVAGLAAEPPYLIVDIGGGSTEFVTGADGVEHAISMDIGCVRMTERHLHDDPPTAAQIEAATRGHHGRGGHRAGRGARPRGPDPGRAGRDGHHGHRARAGPARVRRRRASTTPGSARTRSPR